MPDRAVPKNTATEAGAAPATRDAGEALALLQLVAGIWLIVAPWVLPYGSDDPKWNDVVLGAIVAVLALLRFASAGRTALLSAATAIAGAWVFAAALWWDSSATASWNDLITGATIFVLAVLTGFVAGGRRDARAGLPA